ncbi:transposase, partial [Gallibacterium salpingitidis]
DAKQHHGHRYARYRGLANVQMQCFLAAMAQNIKKIALVVWAFLSYLWRQFCLFEAWVKQSEKITACSVI